MSIRLYRHPISGHCHRVEWLLKLLDLPFDSIDVDLLAGAHRQPAFLARNAFGQVPVLEDGDLTLADSNAILVYLALRYDPAQRFYPREPMLAGRIQRWLSAAAGPLTNGPARLRAAALLGAPVDRASAEKSAAQLFAVMEGELAQPYLTGSTLTIADMAMYAYTARAPEGGLSLEAYPRIVAWLARIEQSSRFLPMPKATG